MHYEKIIPTQPLNTSVTACVPHFLSLSLIGDTFKYQSLNQSQPYSNSITSSPRVLY